MCRLLAASRVLVRGVCAAAIALSGLMSTAIAQELPPPSPMLLGVYEGNQGWDVTKLRALETWQGKPNAVVVLFTSWESSRQVQDNLFLQQLPAIWNNGNVPLVTWEPFTGQTTPADIARRIAGGEFDGYVEGWAARLRTFLAGPDRVLHTFDDRRVYIRFAHEMNGNWYPWAQASPGDYIAMWLRVRGTFERAGLGASHIQWIWTVNNVDIGPYKAEHFYPGDASVDWVGVDGFNWGHTASWFRWQQPADVFTPMVTRLRAISTRPLAVTETGTTYVTRDGASVAAKNDWLRQLFPWAEAAGVRMICAFNADTDGDFSFFGGKSGDAVVRIGKANYRTYAGYRDGVAVTPLTSADRRHPRLLTDGQFQGR